MNFPPNGFYLHYKHDPKGERYNYTYEVIGVARHTEDKNFLVLYRPLYTSNWFAPASYQARPLEMFMGDVEKDGSRVPRFRRVSGSEVIADLVKVRDSMYGNK